MRAAGCGGGGLRLGREACGAAGWSQKTVSNLVLKPQSLALLCVFKTAAITTGQPAKTAV